MFRIDRNRVKLLEGIKVEEPEDSLEENLEVQEQKPPQEEWEEQRIRLEEEFRLRTEEMINSALEEAERIKSEAQMVAADIKAQAEKSGYSAGKAIAEEELAAAMDELDAEKREQAQNVNRLLDEFRTAKERYFDSSGGDVVELILAVARKVTGTAIEKYDDVFESMIKKALQEMKLEGKLIIRVSSGEYERFFSSGSASFILGDETVTASIVEDADLQSFGCVIESEGETVDTGLDTQFKFIEIAFRDEK